ncbi:hypothetical protein RI129_011504 [Pyrocoelia pectoralis]|uniref:Cytokine receptor n=1 Tax=Pyrocoelia pectoralis TaxID=417401 RepID=A0AAN7V080_9COLE
MGNCKWWFLITILIINAIIGIADRECHNGLSTPGYTDPYGDINIEYGNSLDITCILNDNFVELHPEHSSRNLYFIRDQEVIPSEMIEVVNSTSIKLHIDKPPKSSSVYTCKLMNDSSAVCINNVVVGTKPQPVTDFKCYGLNFDNLTCTWTAPENYAKTNYNLSYYFPTRAGRNMLIGCPKVEQLLKKGNVTKLRCVWSVATIPQYRQAQRTFYFELNVSNHFGSYQFNYTFSHFPHVRSGPPENLTVINSTTESLYLRWSVPLSMHAFPPGLQHRVLYQSQYEKEWKEAGFLRILKMDDMKNVYFNVTGLKYAHALYDIRVSLRSDAADNDDESMWSANTTVTCYTDSKIPGAPPLTNIGSFEIISSGNTLNQREVFVYWQQIPLQVTNGENFTYYVEAVENPEIRPMETTHAYAKFTNLSVDQRYTFQIWSKNTIGLSEEKSVVVVPKQSDRIKEPLSFTKIAFGNGKYELSWEPPRNLNTPLKSYSLFWCTHDRDRPYQCTGHLSWIELPSDQTVYNITVSEDTIHQFAVSANTDVSSSGMVWAACTVIHNQAIGKMKNVKISQVYATLIQLSWKLECSDRVGSVEGFVIYYCSIVKPSVINCKGPEESLIINDSTAEQANITGLLPYETYMFAVSVITKHNSQSQKSDYQFATTLEAAPSIPTGLDVINVTNTSISLIWNRPNITNGKLKYYHITYNGMRESIGADVEEYTIYNLYSYVMYNVSVMACTVYCSEPSAPYLVRTLVGYPGKCAQPGVTFQNNSYISVEWERPEFPRGENEVFEVKFKEKLHSENWTHPIINVTGTKYGIEDCGSDGKYDTFYVSVRAVNIFNGERYEGPWSEELESFCHTSGNLLLWMLLPFSVMFIIVMVYIGRKMYFRYLEMIDVEVKLPPGLLTIEPVNISLSDYEGCPKIEDYEILPTMADKELLLLKRSGSQNMSGDSSGCSSAHESVTASIESTTHSSNSSDSGTEQPRSSSTEELQTNSLRLRNVAANRPISNKGYITMPMENTKTAPAFCVLNTDQAPIISVNPSYVPVPITQTEPQKMPYVLPDHLPQPTPRDLNKPSSSGYVPLNSPQISENKDSEMVDLVSLESYKSTDSRDNLPVYMQVADPTRKVDACNCNQPPLDIVALETGYVSIGDAPAPRAPVEISASGYVPQRCFDVKTLKED